MQAAKRRVYAIALAGCALLAVASAGCGGEQEVPRYPVSGKVTYGNQPVPYGEIMFSPDSSQQNSGPGSIALIQNGEYETFAGKGVIGGPHRVRISGLNAIPGSVPESEIEELFPPYETTIDLPDSATTHNFEIPAATP